MCQRVEDTHSKSVSFCEGNSADVGLEVKLIQLQNLVENKCLTSTTWIPDFYKQDQTGWSIAFVN